MSNWQKFVARLAREPVMLGELIKSAITVSVAFGAQLTVEQIATLYGFVSVFGAFVVRMFVSPGGKDETPKDPPASTPKPPSFPPLTPAAAVLLALSFLFAPALPACSSSQTPQAQAAQARNYGRLAYSAATLGVNVVNEVSIAAMKAAQTPEQAKALAPIADQVNAGLHQAREALEAVRPWLEGGPAGSVEKEKLLEALDSVALAAGMLASAGVNVPPEVLQGVAAARTLIGGDS